MVSTLAEATKTRELLALVDEALAVDNSEAPRTRYPSPEPFVLYGAGARVAAIGLDENECPAGGVAYEIPDETTLTDMTDRKHKQWKIQEAVIMVTWARRHLNSGASGRDPERTRPKRWPNNRYDKHSQHGDRSQTSFFPLSRVSPAKSLLRFLLLLRFRFASRLVILLETNL